MNRLSHVAIIMDGNGRWAKKQGLARIEGHKVGLSTAEKIIDFARQSGVKYLSLYVFSTENWKRPRLEISTLFSLAEKYLDGFAEFCENRVKVVVSGDVSALPQSLRQKIEKIQAETQNFDAICVNLCINYGGRSDILQAVAQMVKDGCEISEQQLSARLYNSFMPDPDLIVRTGGQKRLSNFLLYQSAYSELYFTDTLWPDFSVEEFGTILQDYRTRTRKFGGLVDKH